MDAGDNPVQIGDQVGDDFCANVASGDQLANAREAHRDQRKFGRGKKTVEYDEKQNAKKANYKHRAVILPGSIVSAEALQIVAHGWWVSLQSHDQALTAEAITLVCVLGRMAILVQAARTSPAS